MSLSGGCQIYYASCVDLDQATTAKTKNHVGMQQMVAEDECSVDELIPKAKESRKDTEFPRHHLSQRMKNNAPLFRRKSQLVQQKKVVLPRKRSLGIATGANDDNTFPSFDDYLEDDEGNTMESDKHYDNAEEPDSSVLELYELLSALRSNPLDLARFSQEERVHISLLQIVRELNCSLDAFLQIMTWAAKSNEAGYHFKAECVPSRKKMMQNLYNRYNMTGLTPKEELLYLPYSKRTVSIVYFNAKDVFASLLSCPTLNKDENFMFHGRDGGPFAAPSKSTALGDIDTGRCYRKTYNALVKNVGVDMILPCILAMDKTHIDFGGRLQMEPITMSHGLLKHGIRSQANAMRILGYINHSTPAHKPPSRTGIVTADIDLADLIAAGVNVPPQPVKPRTNVTWPTYLLNELHMQIAFILKASGYVELQK